MDKAGSLCVLSPSKRTGLKQAISLDSFWMVNHARIAAQESSMRKWQLILKRR